MKEHVRTSQTRGFLYTSCRVMVDNTMENDKKYVTYAPKNSPKEVRMFGEKQIKVPESEWNEVVAAARKVPDLETRLEELKEVETQFRELKKRWSSIFPASAGELESSALERIQEQLGVPRLVEEAEQSLREALRAHTANLLDELVKDPQWQALLDEITDELDREEIEERIAESLVEWAKGKVDLKELAATIAAKLLENGDFDLERIEDGVAETLQERLTVTLKSA